DRRRSQRGVCSVSPPMRVVYSKRATRDLQRIGKYYREVAGVGVANDVASRIDDVVERMGRVPLSFPPLVGRPSLHVALLVKYPYKIFFRLKGDEIYIYHIRHTARRPWEKKTAT